MTPEYETVIRRYQDARRAQQDACDRLSALLRATYGKQAGDMRYRPAETREIGDAHTAYLQASEATQTAWLATMARD